jgi:hypothetical protein
MSILYVLSFNVNKEPQLTQFDKWKELLGIKGFSISAGSGLDDLNNIKEVSPELKVSPLFLDSCDGTRVSTWRISHQLEDIASGLDEDGYYDINDGSIYSVDVYTLGDEIINISYDTSSSTNSTGHISFYPQRILVESFGNAYRDKYPMGLNLVTLWQEPKVEV